MIHSDQPPSAQLVEHCVLDHGQLVLCRDRANPLAAMRRRATARRDFHDSARWRAWTYWCSSSSLSLSKRRSAASLSTASGWPRALAVEVTDELQNMGIGTALARQTVQRARANGFALLTATTL